MADEFGSQNLVRQSQLLDLLVLDRATMDEWGRIEVLWSYPKVHRVLGFICKSGRFDRTKLAFNLDQLDKVGENGVLVSAEPVETDRDRVQQLESLIGCEVWTDEGKKVGRIQDYVFQLDSGNIRHYLLGSSGLQGLTGKLYSLYPNQILSYGRGRVMVSAGIVPGLELYQVGLDQKLEEKFMGLEERLESKLKRAADRVNTKLRDEQVSQTLQSGVQSWVERARSVASDVKAQVKDRAQDFLDEDWKARDANWDSDRDRRFNDWDDGDRKYRDRRDEERSVDIDFDFDDWDDEPSSPRTVVNPVPKPVSNQPLSNEPIDRPPLPDLRAQSVPKTNGADAGKPAFTAQPRPLSQRDVWDDDDDWV